MTHHRIAGTVAGLLMLFAVAAAPALASKTYTIRVEGQSQTLLSKTTVTVPDSGQIPGAYTSCSWNDPAGPLEAGTNGNWDRALSPPSSYPGLVETILGEKHGAANSSGWYLWINGTYGGAACGNPIQPGDDVVFTGGSYDTNYDPVDLPMYVAGVPAHVSVGTPFSVTVTQTQPTLVHDTSGGPGNDYSYYGIGSGTQTPAQGATVSVGSARATVGADGTATLTATQTGSLTVQATRGTAPSRSQAYPVCVSNGADGTCGTILGVPGSAVAPTTAATPAAPDRTPPALAITGLTGGRRYAAGKGPREVKGSAIDPSGLLMVKLRITRTDHGHCSYFSGKKLAFVGMHCGAAHGSWFKIGSNASWSYLLPKRLPSGRYVVDANAIDKQYNRDDTRRRGSNRVVFEVA